MDRSIIFAALAGVSVLFLTVIPAKAGEGGATTRLSVYASNGSTAAHGTDTVRSSKRITVSKKKNCNKFMKKALRTGRHYWWARYRKCLQRAGKS